MKWSRRALNEVAMSLGQAEWGSERMREVKIGSMKAVGLVAVTAKSLLSSQTPSRSTAPHKPTQGPTRLPVLWSLTPE